MKHKTYSLSRGLFKEVHAKMPVEEKTKMEEMIEELASITNFSNFSERLIFESAMMLGYVASKIDWAREAE